MPAEALLSLRYKSNQDTFLTFGAAGGLTNGIGTAQFRVFIGGGLGMVEPPRPADFDPIGTFEVQDQCPAQEESVNGWNDEDGCPDSLGTLSVRVDGRPAGRRRASRHRRGRRSASGHPGRQRC